ncbi:helicase associated domain-containing protein [Actinacidiphila oryziradicis]|uniref:Helicase-associated domain-containing protein n=1 Tax=Actinacidiphila oryziradicis TaxID=2571141 RepID=A0A4U0RKJ3_9ACTN|nr:helicase associated domain-containing protein [Actinacidiphila oryziradicis]TJZ96261.1 hypothetical protein FCI23_51210 [Actinacidiphila oryziradicis]
MRWARRSGPAATSCSSHGLSAAFARGVAALAQYLAREGTLSVPRAHAEQLPDGTTIKLGTWLMNTKNRRDKLTGPQRAALAEIGVEWV